MLLNEIIRQMEDSEGQTKSAAAPEEAPDVKLNKALEKAAGTANRTAAQDSSVDAVDVLFKTANALAGTEKEAEVAHAALCGQAFADGAIAKFAAYDAQMQTVKTAGMSTQDMSDEALVKAAAEAGYQETLEKLSAEYQAGHDAALQDVHDQAATEFLKGAAEVEVMVNLVQQQSAGR